MFFQELYKILKNLQVWHSIISALGLAVDLSSGGEKNCNVYSFVCIFTIIIITIFSSSSRVVLVFTFCLIKLSLSQPFVHFPPHPAEEEGKG